MRKNIKLIYCIIKKKSLMWFARKNREIKLKQSDLKDGVTVLVPTYNHEDYIAECLESILMQKTNFSVIIFVFIDYCKDKTSEIVRRFEKDYPNQIKIFENKTRLYGGMASIKFHSIPVNTKFWCTLEGDDYWSSEDKLQTQLEVLKKNPEAIATCCRFQVLNKDGLSKSEGPDYISYNVLGKFKNRYKYASYAHTSSILWRNIVRYNNLPHPKKFFDLGGRGDPFLEISMLGTFGTMICTKEVMSVYRITGKGMWTSISEEERSELNKKAEVKLRKNLGFRIRLSILLKSNYLFIIFYYILSKLKIIPKPVEIRI